MTGARAAPLRNTLFRLLAGAFLLAALFHVAALILPSIAEPSPPWRHAVFALTNVCVAAGLARRTRLFVLAFGLLTLQQLASHGAEGWGIYQRSQRVDLASLLVVVAMPAILALLVVDMLRGSSPK